MRKEKFYGIFAAAGMLLLILDTKTALRGASEGISLCIASVVPSLFPFFVVSILLTSALTSVQCKPLRVLGKLCRIPYGSEPILLIGMLGGYPTGAQAVAQAYEAGQLSKKDARRMLGFCSNGGPSFLFGILSGKFPLVRYLWALWLIHLCSSIIVGMLLPGGSQHQCMPIKKQSITLIQAIKKAIANTTMICGWIILCRTILSFLDRWLLWLIPVEGQVAVLGIFELTNGCCELEYVTNMGLRFLICSGILGFGGICVVLQTASVTSSLGLDWYVPGKILQTLVSLLLSSAFISCFLPQNQWPIYFPVYPAAAALCIGIIMIFLRKLKKRSRKMLSAVV